MLAGTWRIATLALLAPAIIGAANSVRVPALPICNHTALYLLAEYKVAVGDSRSAVNLLKRATGPEPRHAACHALPIHERT